MALRRLIARRAVAEFLPRVHREAAGLLLELGLCRDEVELLETALREFVESELEYVAREWPEPAARGKAREVLERIGWL